MDKTQLIEAIQGHINARGGVLHTQQVPDLVNAILPEPEPENPGEEIETLVVTPPADTPVPPVPAPEGDAAL